MALRRLVWVCIFALFVSGEGRQTEERSPPKDNSTDQALSARWDGCSPQNVTPSRDYFGLQGSLRWSLSLRSWCQGGADRRRLHGTWLRAAGLDLCHSGPPVAVWCCRNHGVRIGLHALTRVIFFALRSSDRDLEVSPPTNSALPCQQPSSLTIDEIKRGERLRADTEAATRVCAL